MSSSDRSPLKPTGERKIYVEGFETESVPNRSFMDVMVNDELLQIRAIFDTHTHTQEKGRDPIFRDLHQGTPQIC